MAEDKDITKLAKEIVESKKILNDEEISKELFKLTKTLKEDIGIDIPEDLLIQIISFLGMPDDTFKIVSEEFLNSFEKSLNNTSDKIALAQALNISNVKVEDIFSILETLEKEILQNLPNEISNIKKDAIKRMIYIVINTINDSEGISKRIITIPFEKCNEEATIPTYAHESDAGMDICSLEEIILEPGESKIIKTGIKVAIPKGYEIQVRPRSGLSAKSKLRIANAPGTIDSGYRGEIGIICENIAPAIEKIDYHFDENNRPVIDSLVTGASITIEKGQKIAQLVLSEVPTAHFIQVKELDTTDRDENGFGSTGK